MTTTDTGLTYVKKSEAEMSLVERAVISGDLSKLSPADRVAYYLRVCESLGLNPLTRPFEYIMLQGRLTLYARRDCTDQLRRIHRVSISIVSREKIDDLYIVTARATLPDGRCDEAIGAVSLAGLKGDQLANAIMRCETKAKRRVTLSIVGLGWLDETEIASIEHTEVRVDSAGNISVPEHVERIHAVAKATEDIATVEPAERQRADDPQQNVRNEGAKEKKRYRFVTRRPVTSRPFARKLSREWTIEDWRDYYDWSCEWLRRLGVSGEEEIDLNSKQALHEAALKNVALAKETEKELAEICAKIVEQCEKSGEDWSRLVHDEVDLGAARSILKNLTSSD